MVQKTFHPPISLLLLALLFLFVPIIIIKKIDELRRIDT